jgi:hypothetical protein
LQGKEYGLAPMAVTLAVDPVLSVMAIGTRTGRITM